MGEASYAGLGEVGELLRQRKCNAALEERTCWLPPLAQSGRLLLLVQGLESQGTLEVWGRATTQLVSKRLMIP